MSNDELRQLEAWEQCCRRQGCAAPEGERYQRARELEQRWRDEATSREVVADAHGLIACKAMGTGESFASWLERVVAKVPPEVLERLRPVLHAAEIASCAAEQAAHALADGLRDFRAREAAS